MGRIGLIEKEMKCLISIFQKNVWTLRKDSSTKAQQKHNNVMKFCEKINISIRDILGMGL